MNNYLDELNPAQRQAVENTDGPTLVIAGAGSGKTRVLTYRIAHLLRKGVRPQAILALTFTNKAAREMKARIAQVAGQQVARELMMGTFHAVFSRILRFEHERIGFPSDFTIYDTTDAKNLIKTIVKDLHLDPQAYAAGDVLGRISMAKNNLVTAQAYTEKIQLHEADAARHKPFLYKVYQEYAKRCFKAGAMDFDDLLLFTNVLLRDHPDVLQKYQQRFQYLLVDEYQDTNHSQYRIIRQLAGQHQNLCVVGDDAQSIYSFRGARIENILNFQTDYPAHQVFKLEQNYRSTQNIVNAANSIIAKNLNQLKKNTFSEKDEGAKIKLVQSFTDNEEGFLVAGAIQQTRAMEGGTFSDFAILYRTNAQSRIMEEALRKKNIPYKIYGGTSFYQRKEVRDVLGYLRLVVNRRDDEAFKRIVNYPKRGIGDTTIEKIEQLANHLGLSIWNTIATSQTLHQMLNRATLGKLHAFMEQIDQFDTLAQTTDAHAVAADILRVTGIQKELFESRAPEDISRHQNVQELLNGIREFVAQRTEAELPATLGHYLQDVALLTDMDKQEQPDTVTLMTIHSAKGLEFKHVFLVGMEEDLFPNQMTSLDAQELEEERRLFYVAVTRAEKSLQISFARSRYKWGKLTQANPSRFLRDIDPQYVEASFSDDDSDSDDRQPGPGSGFRRFGLRADQNTFSNRSFGPPPKPNDPTPTIRLQGKSQTPPQTPPKPMPGKLAKMGAPTEAFQADNPQRIQAGMRIVHQRFGLGSVTRLDGSWPDTRATIHFDTEGIKVLLLKFAKLRIEAE